MTATVTMFTWQCKNGNKFTRSYAYKVLQIKMQINSVTDAET